MSKFRYLPLVIAVFILILGVVAWRLVPDGRPASQQGQALVGGPFTLTDHTGKTVTDKDFNGKYLLVFFGYTYCPDVCPMELSALSAAMDELEPKFADKVQPLFITIDPERDSVTELAEYVQHFTPRLVGLTGTPEEIQQVAKAYRVYYRKAGDESDSDYLMDHSALIFVMGPDGSYVSHFSGGVTPDAMVRKLREIVT